MEYVRLKGKVLTGYKKSLSVTEKHSVQNENQDMEAGKPAGRA